MSLNLPSDPADLFAELYDELPGEPFAGDEANRWYFDPMLTAFAYRVRDDVTASGHASPALLARLEAGDSPLRFAALRGLDLALDALNPFAGVPVVGLLNDVAIRYADTGRFNATARGGLLPRCAFPGRPPGLPNKPDYFSLVRVPQAVWETVDYGPIGNASGITLGRFGPTPEACNAVVGCTPLVGDYDDLTIERTWRRSFVPYRPAYRIAPKPEAVAPMIGSVVPKLVRYGADIAVAPEASLSDELLASWLSALDAATDLDADAEIAWVLVGTGPLGKSDPPVNRALLVDRGGRPLIEQDKLHDFTLTARQARDWRLTRQLGSVRRVEDITRGERLQIRESSYGRIAIVICEDATRPDVASTLGAFGVSHIFVPIFSPPVRDTRVDPPRDGWAVHTAAKYAADVGAWVIVATNLAIGRARDPDASPLATSVVVGPRDDRDEWELVTTYGEAAAPDDICLFDVPPALSRRFTEFV